MNVKVRPWRRLKTEELMLLSCGVGPLDCNENKPVNPKGTESWLFIRRTEAEAPILWLPDVDSQLIRKDPDAGKDWRQEEKGTTKDKMVGWHHWLIGHEFEQALGDGEGQGSLACWSLWGHKELNTTEQQQYSIVYIFHCVHILHCLHLFLIEHIDHLHVLSITNNAEVTLGYRYLFNTDIISLGNIYPEVGWLNHIVVDF